MSHAQPKWALLSIALALSVTACPSGGADTKGADKKDAKGKTDPKRADAKGTDAKKPDAKTPDAKTPDAKAPDAEPKPTTDAGSCNCTWARWTGCRLRPHGG